MGITQVGLVNDSGSSEDGMVKSINHEGNESFLDLFRSISRFWIHTRMDWSIYFGELGGWWVVLEVVKMGRMGFGVDGIRIGLLKELFLFWGCEIQKKNCFDIVV